MQRKKSCQATTMDDNSRIKIKTFACSINDTGFFFLPFVGRVWTIVLYEVITNLGRIFFWGSGIFVDLSLLISFKSALCVL